MDNNSSFKISVLALCGASYWSYKQLRHYFKQDMPKQVEGPGDIIHSNNKQNKSILKQFSDEYPITCFFVGCFVWNKVCDNC